MKHWLHAFRLRTLPLAVSSILVGSALAAFRGSFQWVVFALALVTAILLQVLSNLANDLGDHEHGTDDHERVGPQRAVQSGAITPDRMKRALWICGALALISGVALLLVAFGATLTTLVFLGIGLLAIAAAVRYTYGGRPYGYAGLGDISVLLFFGIVGVMGTFYLHTGSWWTPAMLPAIGFGLLATGVLNTNNLRDIVNDEAKGKRTLAVRLGVERDKVYHALLIVGGLGCLAAFTGLHFRAMAQWGFLIATPMLASQMKRVLQNLDPRTLDPELKRLALGTFLCAIAFSIGLSLVR
ncbi:MAG: 1,4-dihydroxy-2-naphthoate polyprenyltransferase [Flavobacteriales bacterium]|nr:1,4-dihydroxy-2-naphthoate polyprenyltransferase [Flavobacteriales bacterium]MCB9194358.1 1,4-dihydroxy-2-naphthoate polyprenyltransferase [Flavobacteriales bacterium]